MWQDKDGALYRAWKFKDFTEAFAFMTAIAKLAEQMDHHPKWTNEYNKLEIWLSSHDAGGKVTEKDKQMAAGIDSLYGI